MAEKLKRAIVIGATGLVGQKLIAELQQLPECEQITVAVRKEVAEFKAYSKVEQLVIHDFLMLNDEDVSQHSHAFSCLGTTLAKAGSKEAFYNTDYGINAHFAELTQDKEIHFILISAMGANSRSPFFYSRVKGQLEGYIQSLNIKRISILRPSLLMGKRLESRLLEDLSQTLFKGAEKYLPKSFKFRPVSAAQVAHAMVEVVKNQSKKYQVYDNLEIQHTLNTGEKT